MSQLLFLPWPWEDPFGNATTPAWVSLGTSCHESLLEPSAPYCPVLFPPDNPLSSWQTLPRSPLRPCTTQWLPPRGFSLFPVNEPPLFAFPETQSPQRGRHPLHQGGLLTQALRPWDILPPTLSAPHSSLPARGQREVTLVSVWSPGLWSPLCSPSRMPPALGLLSPIYIKKLAVG